MNLSNATNIEQFHIVSLKTTSTITYATSIAISYICRHIAAVYMQYVFRMSSLLFPIARRQSYSSCSDDPCDADDRLQKQIDNFMNILSNYKLSLVVYTKLSDTEKGHSDANKIKLRVCVFIKKERKTKHDAHFFHLRDIRCQLRSESQLKTC